MITHEDARLFLHDYARFVRRAISFVGTAIRKSRLSFILIAGMAAAASVWYWYRQVPYYETDMSCGYNNERLSRKTYGEKLQKLNLLAQSGSAQELARLLTIPPEEASKILRIDAKNMVGSPLYEDITGNYQAFYIVVRAKDRSVFPLLEPALPNYLGDGPYQSQVGRIELKRLDQKIAYLDRDIAKTDSIIDAYTVFLRNGRSGGDSTTGFRDITALLSHKEELEDKRASLEQRKAFESGPGVSVVHGFAPADHPVKGDKKKMLIGIVLGLLAATGWAVCNATWRRND